VGRLSGTTPRESEVTCDTVRTAASLSLAPHVGQNGFTVGCLCSLKYSVQSAAPSAVQLSSKVILRTPRNHHNASATPVTSLPSARRAGSVSGAATDRKGNSASVTMPRYRCIKIDALKNDRLPRTPSAATAFTSMRPASMPRSASCGTSLSGRSHTSRRSRVSS